MTHTSPFIHGIYPRSSELVQITRDVDRKRLNTKELQAQQKKDLKKLISLQQSLDFSFIEDGKLTWQDIFRPIVEATEGMEAGPLTRWFDNNSFYRQPIINGQLKLDETKLEKYFPSITPATKWKVTLPSPYTFAKLTKDKSTSSFEKTLDSITEIMNKLFTFLVSKGVALFQLSEPYLPYHKTTNKEIKLLLKALSLLKDTKPKVKIALHCYFGDATPIITALTNTYLVDGIGIDFYKTNLSALPKKFPFPLIAGIVEGRNSLIESETTLKKFIEKIITTLQPETLYLSHNSDLELLPEPVAREKLKVLSRVCSNFNS